MKTSTASDAQRAPVGSDKNVRWAIVGGGMLGLTLAWRLARSGGAVTVFETAPDIGGLAGTWQIGDVRWDRHYHVTLLSDLHLRGLLAELGIEKEMRWSKTRTGFFTDGTLHSLSNLWEFATFAPLNMWQRLRLGLTIAKAARLKEWRPLERVTAKEWLRQWSGPGNLDRIWMPLLRSKLGENAERVAATFIGATIARMYAVRQGHFKEERFGYHPGGYARILQRFAEALSEKGVALRAGERVEQVRTRTDGTIQLSAPGGAQVFDRVILTLPSPAAADICPQLHDAEREAHGAIEYQGIVCASALLRKPLAGFYVTNLADPELPFTGIIEMTALVDPQLLGHRHLVYLPKYAEYADPIWKMSDGDIRRLFVGGLRRVYPHVSDADVVEFEVSRVGRVFALPTLGYSDRLPSMRTSVPGLTIVNSAHIVDGTLNVNETIRLANENAPWLLRERGGSPPKPAREALNPWIDWWRDFECEDAYRSAEARRFVKEARNYVGVCPNDRVLDIGCGPGYLADCIAHLVREFHGLDVSQRQLNRARIRLAGLPNVVFHALDPEAYTDLSVVSSHRFSLIVCVSVVQYYRDITELEGLLRNVSRLVEPGGRMIVADMPDADASPGEPFRLLWRCWKEQRLMILLRFLMSCRWEGYLRRRRRYGLLRFRAAELEELVARLGFRSTVIRAPLTTLAGRLHLLIRFS